MAVLIFPRKWSFVIFGIVTYQYLAAQVVCLLLRDIPRTRLDEEQ
jgi:hypothetical protein